MVRQVVRARGKSPLKARFEYDPQSFKSVIPGKLLDLSGGEGAVCVDVEDYPKNSAKLTLWDEQPGVQSDSDRNFLEVSAHDCVPYETKKRILFVDVKKL